MEAECLYSDDWVQLWWGDALDLVFIPDNSIDLIVTSPPYNIGIKKDSEHALWHGVKYGTDDDKKPEKDYQKEQIQALSEMYRVTKPGSSLFYNHKVRNRNGMGIHPLSWISQSDWNFRQEIVWDRGSTHNHEMTYFWPHNELIFWLTKGTKDIYLSPDGAKMSTVWTMQFLTRTKHPAPFPIELPSRCIRATTRKGAVVLDPYGGSFTTCRAAKTLGRYSIGVDKVKEYIEEFQPRFYQGVLL